MPESVAHSMRTSSPARWAPQHSDTLRAASSGMTDSSASAPDWDNGRGSKCAPTNHDDLDQSARPRLTLWQRPAGTHLAKCRLVNQMPVLAQVCSPERVDEAYRRPSTSTRCAILSDDDGGPFACRSPATPSFLGLTLPTFTYRQPRRTPVSFPRRSGGAHVHPSRTEGALQPRPRHASPRTTCDL
ncbi:hypothetical protein L227DRAFT_117832 [Lentinus tigrinus ALCF2SS1-6]|uniref:Uncharacterized protein n=1 Tax=Lentinus tigrinus ALCF2SS1-6 TaxID=1328759 RepID=A0A5C2S9Y2_9APHY|nr:hypothetical protein L227DRAFT_117832 [Lentinus tigrinus ALCF2SS1-6]